MKFSKPRHEEQEIDITPLIDVVFILLIFFMVTTTFQKETTLSISLPKSSKEAKPVITPPLEIVINARGQFYIGGQELVNNRLDTVKQALAKYTANNKEQPLIIRADGLVAHQYVVTAMDAAAQLGLRRLSIATMQASDAP
ncbi:MAG: biopolymer transporter ExbD [Gammaproteobacteria bacterium]|nr:biopolymer transporter ExbD [Gammaproteobacteria bacterium]